MKTHVKICGITRTEDAFFAECLGASAIGFIFYPKSRRYIDPKTAGAISVALGPFIARVGVFVDEDLSTVIKTATQAKLTAVQLHGSQDNLNTESIRGVSLIKAFRVDSSFDCGKLKNTTADAFLLDTYIADDTYGGTGKTFDWNIAAQCSSYGKLILAGGLNAGNIAEAVKTVSPWAVDLSSGVELSPGIKDHAKMKTFFDRLDEIDVN